MLAHTPIQERAPDLVRLPDVFVLDNLLTEPQRQAVLRLLRKSRWEFGWKSHRADDQYSFWHQHYAGRRGGKAEYDCAAELAGNSKLLHALWQYLEKHIFKGRTLVRCYANGQAYGSDGTLHTDSKQPDSYTAIYYPHDAWQPNWAGETVLFNTDNDIVRSVYPKPNRMLVFRGNIPHLARGVSRTCPELRITLMYKTGTPNDRSEA